MLTYYRLIHGPSTTTCCHYKSDTQKYIINQVQNIWLFGKSKKDYSTLTKIWTKKFTSCNRIVNVNEYHWKCPAFSQLWFWETERERERGKSPCESYHFFALFQIISTKDLCECKSGHFKHFNFIQKIS